MFAMRGLGVKGNACIHPTVCPFFWEFNGIPIHLVYVHSKTLQYSLLQYILQRKKDSINLLLMIIRYTSLPHSVGLHALI